MTRNLNWNKTYEYDELKEVLSLKEYILPQKTDDYTFVEAQVLMDNETIEGW